MINGSASSRTHDVPVRPRALRKRSERVTLHAGQHPFDLFWTQAYPRTRKVAVFLHGHAGSSAQNTPLRPAKQALLAEGWNLLEIDRPGAYVPDRPIEFDDRPPLAMAAIGLGLDFARKRIPREGGRYYAPMPVLLVGFSEGCQLAMSFAHRWASDLRSDDPIRRMHAERLDIRGVINGSPVSEVDIFSSVSGQVRERSAEVLELHVRGGAIPPAAPISDYFYLLPRLPEEVAQNLIDEPISVGRFLQVLTEGGFFDYFPFGRGVGIYNPTGLHTLSAIGRGDFFNRPFVKLLDDLEAAQKTLRKPPLDTFATLDGGHGFERGVERFADLAVDLSQRAMTEPPTIPDPVSKPPEGWGYGGVSNYLGSKDPPRRRRKMLSRSAGR